MQPMTTNEALAALGELAGTLRSVRARAEAIADAVAPSDLEALLDEADRSCWPQDRLDFETWHAARRVLEGQGSDVLLDLVEELEEFLTGPAGLVDEYLEARAMVVCSRVLLEDLAVRAGLEVVEDGPGRTVTLREMRAASSRPTGEDLEEAAPGGVSSP
jgi:hypothetical protein